MAQLFHLIFHRFWFIYLESGQTHIDVPLAVQSMVDCFFHHESDVSIFPTHVYTGRGVMGRIHLMELGRNHVGQFRYLLPRILILGCIGGQDNHMVGRVICGIPVGPYHTEADESVRFVQMRLQIIVHSCG